MILAYIVYAIVGLWILGTGAVFFSAWLEDRKTRSNPIKPKLYLNRKQSNVIFEKGGNSWERN